MNPARNINHASGDFVQSNNDNVISEVDKLVNASIGPFIASPIGAVKKVKVKPVIYAGESDILLSLIKIPIVIITTALIINQVGYDIPPNPVALSYPDTVSRVI
jgi:hypothetical protein